MAEPGLDDVAWIGTGECVVGLARCPAGIGTPPSPLRRTRGPVLIVAARYTSSPVGPYLEIVVSEPVRVGLRFGMCATVMVVNSVGSCEAGRAHWGFPKEIGTLSWSSQGEEVSLRWEERAVVVSGRPVGRSFPAIVPFRSLQTRADGPVRFGGSATGRARCCRMEVEVEPGDPLAPLAGRHPAIHLTAGRVRMDAARRLQMAPATRPKPR